MRIARPPSLFAAAATDLFGAVALAAGVAAPWSIIDAHLHCSDEATTTCPVADVMQRFRDRQVRSILANRRPFRTTVDPNTWGNDPAISTRIEDEFAREIGWRDIGEFPVYGRDADSTIAGVLVHAVEA